MSEIGERLIDLKASLPPHVSLVAVSKFHPASDIEAAYAAGQRAFGESREQELSLKRALLPEDIEWHFIGHLQTNKVRNIAPFVSMIQSVDSVRLMREINRRAAECNRVINILLELHIAEESAKTGLTTDACRELLADGEWRTMSNIHICGLMMMASFVDDEQQIRREFNTAAEFFDEVKKAYFADDDTFCVRSWGMSDDYMTAVECRSTMVRVGTAIFGPRAY